jgi:hypothetical protein
MKAYRRISKRALVGYYLYVWLLPAICVAMGVVYLVAYLRNDVELYGSMFWVACIGLGVAFGLPARYRLGVRRAFNQRNVLANGKPMYCEFDDSTVHFVVPGGTEIGYPWGTFTDYFENDKVAVLFVKDAAFHTIPKRAMDEDGWDEFRAQVRAHGKKA